MRRPGKGVASYPERTHGPDEARPQERRATEHWLLERRRPRAWIRAGDTSYESPNLHRSGDRLQPKPRNMFLDRITLHCSQGRPCFATLPCRTSEVLVPTDLQRRGHPRGHRPAYGRPGRGQQAHRPALQRAAQLGARGWGEIGAPDSEIHRRPQLVLSALVSSDNRSLQITCGVIVLNTDADKQVPDTRVLLTTYSRCRMWRSRRCTSATGTRAPPKGGLRAGSELPGVLAPWPEPWEPCWQRPLSFVLCQENLTVSAASTHSANTVSILQTWGTLRGSARCGGARAEAHVASLRHQRRAAHLSAVAALRERVRRPCASARVPPWRPSRGALRSCDRHLASHSSGLAPAGCVRGFVGPASRRSASTPASRRFGVRPVPIIFD